MDAHDHQRRRAALDRLADVFADALERIAPLRAGAQNLVKNLC
jgi:hypothetical protein